MLTDRFRDFLKGFRQLRQRPGFALAAIASLALGIGANTILFGLVDTLLFQDVPGVQHGERLVEIGRSAQGQSFDTIGAPDLADIATGVPALDAVFGFQPTPLNIRTTGEPRRALGFLVSDSYFDAFGEPRLGRAFGDGDASGVVLSDAAWRTHFQADPNVIGRSVTVNGAPLAVVGVAPATFRGHVGVLQPEFYVPLALAPAINAQSRETLDSRTSHWLLAGGRLAPGATIEQAKAQLDALAQRLAQQYPASHAEMAFDIAGLRALPAGAGRGAVQLFAGAMFALVGLILLLACVNVAGMLLARGESRGAEFALRAAIGASRARLAWQLFAEGLVLAILSCAAGFGLAVFGARLIERVEVPAPFPLALSLPLAGEALAFALGVSIITAVLFAVWPALRVSQNAPRGALSAGGSTGTLRRTRARDMLVVVQFAVSALLLVAAGLFLRSLQAAADIDPGFRSEGVAYAEFDLQPAGYTEDRAPAMANALLERVRAMPGVESATVAAVLPLSMSRMGMGSVRAPTAPEARIRPDVNVIDGDFFRTLDIDLRGRDFTPADAANAPRVAVINETFARQLFGTPDAIGRTFELGSGESWTAMEVVGVAADGKYATLSEERTPFLFLPQAQVPRLSLHVLMKSSAGPLALERALRREWAAVDANLPMPVVHGLSEVTSLAVLPQRIAGSVASAVGLVGALLAATGLYGVMAFYVAQRRREIGVRLAVGASRGRIVRAITGRAARLTAIGLGIGLVLAAVAAQGLASLLVGVDPMDAWAFSAATIALVLAALVATLGPALRAASVQPTQALRYE